MVDDTCIQTDVNLKSSFTSVCSFVDNVDLVRVPSDFVHANETNSNYHMNATVGAITHGYAQAVENYQVQNPDQGGRADFFDVSSLGGTTEAAIKIIDMMRDRREVVLVDGVAASSGSLIAVSGDNVYMTAESTFMTHEARKYSRDMMERELTVEEDRDLQNLRFFTKKEPPYFASDYRIASEGMSQYHSDDPDVEEKYRLLQQRYANEAEMMEGFNNQLIEIYMEAHPSMTREMATELISNGDLTITAEQALKLGFVDAVLQEDGMMLVRSSDPRAEELRNSDPDLYAQLNQPDAGPAASSPDPQAGVTEQIVTTGPMGQ